MSADPVLAEVRIRGSGRLTLHANRLVHEGDGTMEAMPLAQLASVRVAFERDARKLNWAIGLLFGALILAAVSGPLQGAAASLAAGIREHAGRESLDGLLLASVSALGGLARLMAPVAALLAAIAAGLLALFWLGATVLTLSFAATERRFELRGRQRDLVDFAHAVADQLAARRA